MVEIEFYREMQTTSTTTGASMAVKKTLMDGYTYQDMFDTQEALDSGLLNQVSAGTTTTYKKGTGWLNKNEISGGSKSDWMANKDTLGSILGQTEAIAANRKRRLEQQKMAQAGVGTQQSILGGGAF